MPMQISINYIYKHVNVSSSSDLLADDVNVSSVDLFKSCTGYAPKPATGTGTGTGTGTDDVNVTDSLRRVQPIPNLS